MAMDSATHTRDSVTLLTRTWVEPLRRLTGRWVKRRSNSLPAAPAPPSQSAGGDRGAILLAQVASARCVALADALTAAGYDVRGAQGLPAAMASLARRAPALVVVDGHADQAAYQTLRRAGAFPILALMAEPTDEQVLTAFTAGVDDCQKSGISKEELVVRIDNLLRVAGRPPAAGASPNADSEA